jgi:hypothetical protein
MRIFGARSYQSWKMLAIGGFVPRRPAYRSDGSIVQGKADFSQLAAVNVWTDIQKSCSLLSAHGHVGQIKNKIISRFAREEATRDNLKHW